MTRSGEAFDVALWGEPKVRGDVHALSDMMIQTPAGAPVRLRFKWSDNVRGEDPLAWLVDGDAAPNGRAAYRYQSP